MQPDFSVKMLKSFLDIRVHFENRIAYQPGRDSIRIEKQKLQRDAGVTEADFKRVCHGWPVTAEVRTRLWAALGVFPGVSGWVLTDDGGQTRTGVSHDRPAKLP
jgi:hypothetical protein